MKNKSEYASEGMSDEQILLLITENATFERGFRCLMAKYQEKIYWHIRRMVKDHEDANDVIQNTFIKIYKGIENFKGNSKLYTWIYRIATNETLSFLNKKKKASVLTLHDHEQLIKYANASDQPLDSEDIQNRLKNALDMLPDRQKLVFNMRYYQEMSYKEISDVLNTSVGALKASYHIAAKKIESYLIETF